MSAETNPSCLSLCVRNRGPQTCGWCILLDPRGTVSKTWAALHISSVVFVECIWLHFTSLETVSSWGFCPTHNWGSLRGSCEPSIAALEDMIPLVGLFYTSVCPILREIVRLIMSPLVKCCYDYSNCQNSSNLSASAHLFVIEMALRSDIVM